MTTPTLDLDGLTRVAAYVRSREEKPLRQMDDVIHGVHMGTQWEATLHLSDLKALLDRISLLEKERDEALGAFESVRKANDTITGLANRNNDARLAAEARSVALEAERDEAREKLDSFNRAVTRAMLLWPSSRSAKALMEAQALHTSPDSLETGR